MKKIISLFLCLTGIFSSFSALVIASAEDSTPPYCRIVVEGDEFILEQPDYGYYFKVYYDVGEYKTAQLKYSTNGDVKLDDIVIAKVPNSSAGYSSFVVSSNSIKGGTITAELVTPEGEVICSDTVKVRVSVTGKLFYPLYALLGGAWYGTLITSIIAAGFLTAPYNFFKSIFDKI